MIGRHKDFSLFTRTDLYVWHGIRSSTERNRSKSYFVTVPEGSKALATERHA